MNRVGEFNETYGGGTFQRYSTEDALSEIKSLEKRNKALQEKVDKLEKQVENLARIVAHKDQRYKG